MTLKVISKVDCHRCEGIKNYLQGRGIEFEEVMAEEKGYDKYRTFIAQMTGKMGFPILEYGKLEPGAVMQYVNGSTEEIIEQINIWYPDESTSSKNTDLATCTHALYDWGMCEVCGHKGEGYKK